MKPVVFISTLLWLSAPSQAQSQMSVADGFDAGLTLPWLFPEQTIALVAAGFFLGQRHNARLFNVMAVFLLCLGVGLFVPPTTFSLRSLSLTLLSMAFVLAFWITLQRTIPTLVATTVAAVSGLVEGTASAPGAGNLNAALGVAAGSVLRASLLIVATYLLAHYLSGEERHPWARIALRVIGSWVAAIAIMMLALLMASPA